MGRRQESIRCGSSAENWFIFSPNTVDNRCGEWAGRLIVSIQGCHLSALRFCLFLVTRHSSLSTAMGSMSRGGLVVSVPPSTPSSKEPRVPRAARCGASWRSAPGRGQPPTRLILWFGNRRLTCCFAACGKALPFLRVSRRRGVRSPALEERQKAWRFQQNARAFV